MGERAGKHITFEESCSSGGSSDDDGNAVEVVFDPGNPYRRKSSMVASEMRQPMIRRPTRRDECLVHQFLDSQRRAKDAASSASEPDSEYSTGQASTGYMGNVPDISLTTSHTTDDGDQVDPRDQSLDVLVDPKSNKKCRAVVEPDSMDHLGGGQADQQAWTQQMTKSLSNLDLTDYDDVRSRLLTKQQLSDMAWGVRELSRRLSSMRIRFRVKSIFLLTKIYDQDLIPKTRELTHWLLHHDRETAYTVYVQDKLKTNKRFDVKGLIDDLSKGYAGLGEMDEEAAREMLHKRLRYWDEHMCRTRPHTFDFVISLGGDVSLRLRFEGTVMRSQPRKRPELQDEAGEEDGEELHRQRDLVEELIGEEREDEHTHRPDGTFEILNEVVVDRGPNPSENPITRTAPAGDVVSLTYILAMSYTEIFGDDEHFTSVLADGICVSTPTGSTAYNLAAGGSLCHPENPVMLVTSICAHTLSFRPIILPDTIVLRIGVPYNARTASWASFDGRERIELKPGDYVTISASRYPFASVQSEGRRSEDWVNSISGKLGWNTRQKQKSFKEWDK
ncbi:hypothetical protein NW754_011609 [Fusarium falciforme]|nr:hypothetical protein NW754_011609 [Fusarium falciforme]